MGRKVRRARAKPKRDAAPAALAVPASEVAQLRVELAEAREKLAVVTREGLDAYTARRLADLEEARLIARGQALEAAAARSRAEYELAALRSAIERTPGLRGRLLRWAARELGRG